MDAHTGQLPLLILTLKLFKISGFVSTLVKSCINGSAGPKLRQDLRAGSWVCLDTGEKAVTQ